MRMNKIIAMGLAGAMVVATVPTSQVEAVANRQAIKNHWSEQSFQRWVDHSVIEGDENGNLLPEKFMTKAEYIKVLNRFIGAQSESDVNLDDVKKGVWYESEVRKAIAAGYLEIAEEGGKTKVDADEPLTRLEAVKLFCKALEIEKNTSGNKGFNDTSVLTSQERDSIAVMEKIGAINGYPDGSFRPDQVLKRSELVSMLDKGIKAYIDEPGVYKENVKGLVVINSKNVKVEGAQIFGDVVITEKALEAIEIKDSKIFGSLYMDNAGDSEKVTLVGKNRINKIVAKGDLELVVSEETEISEMTIAEDKSELKISGKGKVKKILVKADSVKVNNRKADKNVELKLDGSKGVSKSGSVDTVSSASNYTGTGGSGGSGQLPNNYHLINTDKTSIMEIEHVLYFVVTLNKRSMKDYTFYLNNKVVQPTKVNTEGTIVKYELSNIGSYTIKINDGAKEETVTRSRGL